MAKKKSKSSIADVFSRAQKLLGENRPSTNRNPFVIMPEGEYNLHIYADPTNLAFFRFRVQHKVTIGGQTLKLISPRLTREANAEIEDIGYDESPLDDRIEELMAGSREDQALAKRIKITEFVVFYGRVEWHEPPEDSDEPTEGLIMCTMSDFGKIIRAITEEIGDAGLEPDTKLVLDIEREGWDINSVECLGVEDMKKSEIKFVDDSPSLKERVAPLDIDELKKRLDEAASGGSSSKRRERRGRSSDESETEHDRVASPSRSRRTAKKVEEPEDDDDDEDEEDDEPAPRAKRKKARKEPEPEDDEDDEYEDDEEDEDDEEEEPAPRRKAKSSKPAKKAKKGRRAIADELLDELEED